MVDIKLRSGFVGIVLGIVCAIIFYPTIMQSSRYSGCADKKVYLQMEAKLERAQKKATTMQTELIEMTVTLKQALSGRIPSKETKDIAVIPTSRDFKLEKHIRPEIFRPGVIILGMHRSGYFYHLKLHYL